jgi:predicted permease
MTANMHEFLGRLKSLFRKRRMDREMAEELAFHQDLLREKLIREGMSEQQAKAIARRTFGNPSRWQERLRELWQFRTLENFARDISFSARLLRKSPGFTLIALLTITLGVGANTAVFSLINGLLLRPLPVPHGDELIVLGMDSGGPRPNYTFPAPFFRALENHHEIFAQALAFSNRSGFLVRGKATNENVPGMMVSGSFFDALETPPLMGRYLSTEDDRPGGSPQGLAVVISENFWITWFNHDPNVVGQKLQIANKPFTVVGVMPKRFIGADPTQKPDIFVPVATEPIIDAPEDMIAAGYHGWWLVVMARLQPGVTLEQANAALGPMSSPILHATVPDPKWITKAEQGHFRFFAEPGARGFAYIRSTFQKPLVTLFAMCGGILLLACMNLASLLMARSAARERELATRIALGATRSRLIQQLLVESLLIAGLGAVMGLAFAPVVSHSLATMLISGQGRSMYLDTSLDLRVLGFAAISACAAAVLIGLVPAIQATSRNLNDHMKDGQHATQFQQRKRLFPRILLAAEVGLALLLVVSAGLLATSVMRLYTAGAGFDPNGVANFELGMDKQSLDGQPLVQLYRNIENATRQFPGVSDVSFARMVPLTHSVWTENTARPGGQTQEIYMNGISPDYFKTMRIPQLSGRAFTWNDVPGSGLKMILNSAAAKLFFPNQNPIGQTITEPDSKTSYEIVGVVGDAKYDDLRSAPPATGYIPISQFDGKKPSYTMVVRYSGAKAPLASAVRSIAANLAPDIPAPLMSTMEQTVNDSISAERVMAMLSLFFAGCALLVTGIGLYGTLSYNTARRTSEIGIRMALGARRAGVVALVFRENAVVAIAGTFAGLIAAILTSKVLATFLYETSPRDPWILIVSVATLGIIASAASLIPAILAARIEPIAAIRCE